VARAGFGALTLLSLLACLAPGVGARQPEAAEKEGAAAANLPDRGAGVADEMAATFRGRNGDVFRDWPEPRAVIVFTGELDGYIEPCGCTGKENQKGGLSRRRNFLGARRSAG